MQIRRIFLVPFARDPAAMKNNTRTAVGKTIPKFIFINLWRDIFMLEPF
jgi:hypothetical protein